MKPLAAATAARNWSGLTLAPSTGAGICGSVQPGCANAGMLAHNNTVMDRTKRTATPFDGSKFRTRRNTFARIHAAPLWYESVPQKCQEAVRKMSGRGSRHIPVRQPAIGITYQQRDDHQTEADVIKGIRPVRTGYARQRHQRIT